MARNITITFADGSTHTYNNAPDEITPEQVIQRAEKDFGLSVASVDGGRKAEETPKTETPPPSPPKEEDSNGLLEMGKNALGGALKGASNIGNTLITADQFIKENNPFLPKSENYLTQGLGTDSERRANFDSSIKNLGFDPESGSYKVGQFAGEVAGTAGIPVAKGGGLLKDLTLNALGGATGSALINPELSDIGIGAGIGAGGSLLGKGINAIKEYFPNSISHKAGTRLNEITSNKDVPLKQRIENISKPDVPGYQQSLAEVLHNGNNRDEGIASFYRSMQSIDPLGVNSYKSRIQDFEAGQQAALHNNLDNGILKQGEKEAAKDLRELATKPIYDNLPTITPSKELAKISKQEAFKDSLPQARKIVSNLYGEELKIAYDEAGNLITTDIPGRHLQAIKQSMLDLANKPNAGDHYKTSIKKVYGDYVSALADDLPELRQADKLYGEHSKPLNKSAIFETLRDTSHTATDGTGKQFIENNKFIRLMNDKTKLLQNSADDLTGVTTFEQAVSPDNAKLLDNITIALKAKEAANRSASSIGSPTAQNLSIGGDVTKGLLKFAANKVVPGSGFGIGLLDKVLANSKDRRVNEVLLNAYVNPEIAAAVSDQALTPLKPLISGNTQSVMFKSGSSLTSSNKEDKKKNKKN